MPEMIQGGEMVAAGTMADEITPDAPGGMPAGGTDDAPEGGSLPTGGAGGETWYAQCGWHGGASQHHCPGARTCMPVFRVAWIVCRVPTGVGSAGDDVSVL